MALNVSLLSFLFKEELVYFTQDIWSFAFLKVCDVNMDITAHIRSYTFNSFSRIIWYYNEIWPGNSATYDKHEEVAVSISN